MAGLNKDWRLGNRPQPDIPLGKPARKGEPWRRQYRLIRRGGGRGPVIASEDVSMDDPATRRLWIRIDIVLVALLAVFLLVVGVSALT